MKSTYIVDPDRRQKVIECQDNTSPPRKGMPRKVLLYTENEEKSKAIIARAMAEMYMRMINPV